MTEKEIRLFESRVQVFIDRLKSLQYAGDYPLRAEFRIFSPPVSYANRLKGKYRPISVGEKWGADGQVAWFHLQGRIPTPWRGKTVVARINLGGEGCVYAANGTPLQGLSWHSLWMPEFKRDRFVLSKNARGGEKVDLWIEATAAQIFGLRLLRDPKPDEPGKHGQYEALIQDMTLAAFRPDIWQLYLDCSVLQNLLKALPEKSPRRAQILYQLNGMIDSFQEDEPGVATARTRLVFTLSGPSHASDLKACAVGHAHLDTAWLWPVSETVRKCARTFSTQLALMEKYPEYVFGASQAQHYAFVKEHYPGLYQKIKEKIAAGQWEIQGGMWVEADCNLTGGESLIRQILYGKRYFEKEFGVTVRNLWLPDVFGYSAALPQILAKSGLDFMVTQKISWNQYNRFPYHSFIWRGIDGSDVIVHFPPEDTYNSELWPSGMIYAQENFAERDRLDEFLVLYGIGDGGGGPTEEMIESGLRQKDLEGGPRVVFEPAQKMLDRLEKRRDLLQRWEGELYLEMHRGALTTQAYNKKMNRLCEHKLREVEALYSLLPWKDYPAVELESLWKTVLVNQFHDILPGSSLHIVYEESRKDYESVISQLNALTQKAGPKLLQPHKDALTVINTLSSEYSRPVQLPDLWAGYSVTDEEGNDIPSQVSEGNRATLVSIPPLSSIVLRRGEHVKNLPTVWPKMLVLENNWIRYRFDADGVLRQITDKQIQREVMVAGMRGNLLRLYEDRPVNWDAWDIDIYYENQLLEQAQLADWKWLGQGEVAQVLFFEFTIGGSKIEQRIYLPMNSKRLDFATRISWRENHHMLRAGFEVDIRSSEAAYEIQFGTIKRPTHRNTSWDLARFETVGHRFVDLSEPGYGVALLNDGKYGHKVLGQLLELALLRSPSSPDPEADRGSHQFTYSLLPHAGMLEESDVYREAAQLNQPPALFPGLAGKIEFPLVPDGDHVILETCKKAEDENAWIIRLYEPRGARPSVKCKIRREDVIVYETDLTEKVLRMLPVHRGELALSFIAFEIKTLKIVVK